MEHEGWGKFQTKCKEVIESLGRNIISYDSSWNNEPGCIYYPDSGMGSAQPDKKIGKSNYKETGKSQFKSYGLRPCAHNSKKNSRGQRVCACSGSSPPPDTSYYFLGEPSSELQGKSDNCNDACQRRGHKCNNIMVGNCRSKL